MYCIKCGCELTEEMNFCPKCGEKQMCNTDSDSILKIIEDAGEALKRELQEDEKELAAELANLEAESKEVASLLQAQFSEIEEIINSCSLPVASFIEDAACKLKLLAEEAEEKARLVKEVVREKEKERTDGRNKHREALRELCREFLSVAEAWMDEHLEGADYSKRSTAMLMATKAEGEVSYVCCDLYGDSKAGYAITDEGFYYALPEAYEGITVSGFSFEQLEEDDIRYEDGYLYICDDCVRLALSEWEAKKLCDLLKAIVREFEVIRD